MRCLFAAGAVSLGVLGLGVPTAQRSSLDYGPHAIGFRTEILRPSEGQLAVRIELWYPAAAACASPLSYGDYLRLDAQYPGDDVAAQLRQGWATNARALSDDEWARVTAAPMRACRDSAPAPGRVPVVVALQLPGAWPAAAEYFASHGYAFATVYRPLTSPPSGDVVDRVAQRKLGFVRDLEEAIAGLARHPGLDTARVGAIGQNHALLMLAMRRPEVRAVALQDSLFQLGMEADSNQKTGLWQPERFSAALLHAITSDRGGTESAWDAFRSSMAGTWTRLIIAPPHAGHNDVTADGYLTRVRAPRGDPPHDVLIRVFEGLLRAQRAFFDRFVGARTDAAAIEAVVDRQLFKVERR